MFKSLAILCSWVKVTLGIVGLPVSIRIDEKSSTTRLSSAKAEEANGEKPSN